MFYKVFGILSSRMHVVWALAVGSSLEDRPVYTTSRCVEPYPFPTGMTLDVPAADTVAARAIADAASRLDELREAWLNPVAWVEAEADVVPTGMEASPYPVRLLPKAAHSDEIAQRTLTKLYNSAPAWLRGAHVAVDKAVADAYGWTDYTPSMPDDEILQRLLALNLARTATN